jgi:hypothetical protein
VEDEQDANCDGSLVYTIDGEMAVSTAPFFDHQIAKSRIGSNGFASVVLGCQTVDFFFQKRYVSISGLLTVFANAVTVNLV